MPSYKIRTLLLTAFRVGDFSHNNLDVTVSCSHNTKIVIQNRLLYVL